jgi:hypothetical protein
MPIEDLLVRARSYSVLPFPHCKAAAVASFDAAKASLNGN